jgi:APA family basic amino acid/polyamine antiporter
MPQPGHLKRILGVGFGIAIVVGGTIGAGILRMPATIAQYTSNPWLFISYWIIGGLVALTGAFIYAELGTRYPSAGGPFVMAQRAFGNLGGFITGWCDWIFNAGAISYLAIATAEYLAALLKWELPLGMVSSILIVLLAILQWQGLQLSSNFQKAMSTFKALALLFFFAACITYFFKGSQPAGVVATVAKNKFPLLSAITLSLRAIFITYSGWNTAIYFTEEDTDPKENLPRSLAFGVLSVMMIYVLVNIGLLTVLPLPAMSASGLPAADAAQVIFGGNGGTIVTLIAIISLLGCVNAVLLFTPRILFAVARAGLFFNWTAALNKNAIPGNALIITTAIAVLFSSTGLFNLVINITALLAMMVDLTVYVAVFFVRRKSPPATKTFKAWGYPFNAIFMVLVTLGLIVGLFFEDSLNCIYALIILMIAFPSYFLFKKIAGTKPAIMVNAIGKKV